MRLALFDLDNTLLAGDSDYEWGQFLIDRGVLEREAYESQNRAYYEQYVAGTLDIHEFLGFALRPLAAHEPADLERWHSEFMASRIRPMIGAPARSLVRQHQEAGDLCAIITATNSFVTGAICREFGIPHLIGTIPAVNPENGQFSGSPSGTPSFREGKIERVEAWLASLGLWWGSFAGSFFYSDSHNDLPLMTKVSTPVAVDPDEKLRAHAGQMGWKIITLR
jgi:HAD superfamily hydrolase (TIGR01490 family)